MNSGGRLPFQPIVDRLVTSIADPSVHIRTALDPQYMADFGKQWPVVWVMGQKLVPIDDGRGFSGLQRQNVSVQLLVTLVMQRYPEDPAAVPDADTRLTQLHDAVVLALFGWTPPNARVPFAFASSIDGPASETVCTLNLIFTTHVAYTRSNP